MEPTDDPKLSKLLREWQVSGAPASLDARVLSAHKGWWRFLLTGSIRIPVPVGVAIAAPKWPRPWCANARRRRRLRR